MRGCRGSADGGAVEVLDLPDPRPLVADEVLMEVVAAGVGNWDDVVRTGGWNVGIGLAARERGITMVDLYVHPDGDRLAELLGEGRLTMPVGATYPLDEAAAGPARAVSGARRRARRRAALTATAPRFRLLVQG